MEIIKPEAIGDKAVLFDREPTFGRKSSLDRESTFKMFRRVERGLWQENIEAGLPRFLEFATFLFVKLLEERQQDPLWGYLKAEQNKILYLNRFLIPTLQERYDAENIFPETRITKESLVKKIIAILDNCHLTTLDSDILGDAYEYFLRSDISSKQSLGQFFTPRHIAKVLVTLVSPTDNDTVYDPFCGTGGLLTGAFNHMEELGLGGGHGMFFGKDASVSACVAKMNAILHWRDSSGIEQVGNTLAHPVHQKYSIGLTNVPFARDPKNYPYGGLYENGLARKKTDVLSILHLFQSIQKGGRMAAIVPEGFLCGVERKEARRFLTDNADLRLVASLPHGTFLPYTNVKTAIICLDNIHCPTRQKHFWYFDVKSDGWMLDKQRKKIEGRNDLDILQSVNLNRTPEKELTSFGFIKVPFEKIRENQENWIGKHYQDGSTVPSKYPMVALGKLVTFVSTGFSYKMSQLSDDGVPLFTLKAIGKEFFPKCETKLLQYEAQINEKSRCIKGDILIAMKDKDTKSPILGRATIANRNGIFSSDLVKVEIGSENLLSSEYLYYCFKGDAYANEIKKFAVGSIVKSITLEQIAAIKIPLPPITVQKALVKELNHYEQLIMAQNEAANLLHEKCRERLKSLWG
jgi:type I restriction enzyme M protein